jgi:hypothetical protein
MTKRAASPTDRNKYFTRSKMQDTTVQAPSPVVQDSMFFTLLNRDVRMTVYDFLYKWLPPLPYKKRWGHEDDCRGMVLACKQASMVSFSHQHVDLEISRKLTRCRSCQKQLLVI